jgi:hypothetical protein
LPLLNLLPLLFNFFSQIKRNEPYNSNSLKKVTTFIFSKHLFF